MFRQFEQTFPAASFQPTFAFEDLRRSRGLRFVATTVSVVSAAAAAFFFVQDAVSQDFARTAFSVSVLTGCAAFVPSFFAARPPEHQRRAFVDASGTTFFFPLGVFLGLVFGAFSFCLSAFDSQFASLFVKAGAFFASLGFLFAFRGCFERPFGFARPLETVMGHRTNPQPKEAAENPSC